MDAAQQHESGLLCICGQPRSGTTLIGRLFDGHPDFVSLPDETCFFTQAKYRSSVTDPAQRFYWVAGRAKVDGAKQPMGTLIDPETNWERWPFWEDIEALSDDPKAERQKVIDQMEGVSDHELFLILGRHYAEKVGANPQAKYILEKTPTNEFRWKDAQAIMPGCRFLHMLRDPFECMASRFRHMEGAEREKHLIIGAMRWRKSFWVGVDMQNADRDQHRFLKLESVRSDVDAAMGSVANFLGIAFDEILTRPTRLHGKEGWESNTERKQAVVGKIDQTLQKWYAEESFTKGDLRLVGSILGETYKSAGYSNYADFCEGTSVPWAKIYKAMGAKSMLASMAFPKGGEIQIIE